MALVSNKIDKSMLKRGDHIYSYRKAHLYSYHGIYVGENRVIHYMWSSTKSKGSSGCNCGYDPSKQRGVIQTCLDCFLQNHRLHRFQYNVSSARFKVKRAGTCYTGPCDDPDVVVRRATEKLNKNGSSGAANYSNLFQKHPVCFAVWCMTGNQKSASEVVAKSKLKMAKDLGEGLVNFVIIGGGLYDVFGGEGVGEGAEPSGVSGSEGVGASGEDADEAATAEEDDEDADGEGDDFQ